MCSEIVKPKVLIVGAGPAGIFSALELIKHCDVTIIDKGNDTENRSHQSPKDLSSGVGGAGLYSDGKLCMKLSVGGYLSDILNEKELSHLEKKVKEIFLSELPELNSNSESQVIQNDYLQIPHSNLQSKSYEVINMGTERGEIMIKSFVNRLLKEDVNIMSNTSLENLELTNDNRFRVEIFKNGLKDSHIYDFVILAMGKVGASQQRRVCEKLGVKFHSNPMNLGVRLETSANILRSFFENSKDPKIKLVLPDGSYIKTHCASNNGEVIPVEYDDGILAGGHQYHNKKTDRSGFSLVWNGIRNESINGTDDYSKKLLEPFLKKVGKRLACQRASDFLGRRPSLYKDLKNINMTCSDAEPVNLWELLPVKACIPLEQILRELQILYPEILSHQTVLFAPVIEWWMSTIETKESSMETSIDNLYVAGDGSGWSQGIVHSAATGILAGNSIQRKILKN